MVHWCSADDLEHLECGEETQETCGAWPAQARHFQLTLLPGHVYGQVGQGLGELLAVRGVRQLLERGMRS